jgi:hypothetical protein
VGSKTSLVLSISVLAAILLSYEIVSAENVKSGDPDINDTSVHTTVYFDRGYAIFQNRCGIQTLTQAQLQAGVIPNNIIPCPRLGSSIDSLNRCLQACDDAQTLCDDRIPKGPGHADDINACGDVASTCIDRCGAISQQQPNASQGGNGPGDQIVSDRCLSIGLPQIQSMSPNCPGDHEWWTQVRASHAPGCPRKVYFSYVDPATGKLSGKNVTTLTVQVCGGPARSIHATGSSD